MPMQLSEALILVLDLASENVVDEDVEELQEERERQETAINMVYKHVSEGVWAKNGNDETIIYTRLTGQERED
jgi:hypothetical protein